MDPLPQTFAVLNEGPATGMHIGAQVHVRLHGQVVADLALGNARLAKDSSTHADLPMRTDTLMLWLSAGKPLTAAGIAMLADQGQLSFDDPVVKFIPEFGKNDKQAITLRHLLTHTAGLRTVDTQYPFAAWDETLARIIQMKVERNWIPGQRAGYHTHSTWYLLGEIIRRITGQPCDAWLRAHLFEPLQMKDTHLALSHEQYEVYSNAGRLGFLYDTTDSSNPVPIPNYDTELGASRPRPSASVRGPIRELANFYEMLAHDGAGPDGTQLLKPATVHAIISRQRVGMYDATFRQTIDWGLGIILNSAQYGPAIPYQFGAYASRDTFGHGGSQSSTGFHDPLRKITVCILFNGCPGEPAHDRRIRATLAALYQDLSLT